VLYLAHGVYVLVAYVGACLVYTIVVQLSTGKCTIPDWLRFQDQGIKPAEPQVLDQTPRPLVQAAGSAQLDQLPRPHNPGRDFHCIPASE